MDTTLVADVREGDLGKGSTRKLRAQGRLPGVLYGQGSTGVSLHVDPVGFDTIFRTTRDKNTVIKLKVDGKGVPCLVREIQRHPVSREILHVDFYRLDKKVPVSVDVAIRPVGTAAGQSLGGHLQLIRRTIPVLCSYTDIPQALEVDVTSLNIGDVVSIAQVGAPKGVTLVYENDFNVLALVGRRVLEVEAAVSAEEAAGAEGEEGAETEGAETGDGEE